MREALARSDHDFVAYEDARPARRKSAGKRSRAAGWTSFLTKKPLRALAFVVVAGLLAGIGLNATMFQTARHPAPFFAAPADKQAQKPVATPVPAPRPADLAAQPAARPATQAALRPPMPLLKESADPAGARKNDPIASLIRADGAGEPRETRVAAAQKALQKLGFPVKDGNLRQAVEKFEIDRALPLTGKIGGRTQKELTAQSGIVIP